jgi:hypothetical protein
MLVLLAIVLGAVLGWRRAGARNGDRLDRIQYAAAHGIAFGIGGVALSILIARLGLI